MVHFFFCYEVKVLYYVHVNEEAVVVRFHIDVVNEAAHDRGKGSSHWSVWQRGEGFSRALPTKQRVLNSIWFFGPSIHNHRLEI